MRLTQPSRYSSSCQRYIQENVTPSLDFKQIPRVGSFLFPSSLKLLMDGGPEYLHEHCDKYHKILGPLFREKLGPTELLFVADANLIQQVMLNEGQYPHHAVPDSWSYYNNIKKIDRGLFFQVGETWQKLRREFNKVMLAEPKKMVKFAPDILRLNRDLMDGWSLKFSRNYHNQIVINDLRGELCKWSIEATGLILFGNRMGCVPNENQKTDQVNRAEELVRSVSQMFVETSTFQILPVKLAHRLGLPVWNRFETATTTMLKIASDYAADNISRVQDSEGRSFGIVKELAKSSQLSTDEISRSVVDLIIAAADTTSNSLQWMIYLLAKYPVYQSKIYHEVKQFFKDMNSKTEFETLKKSAPTLSAFVKETSRLYPTAPFLARTLDKKISLAGYSIPANQPIVFSLYTTSRMDKYFRDPSEFKPERWLRNSDKNGESSNRCNSSYASLPFGVGRRMCIGRRAAELEMCLFLASLVNSYQVHLIEGRDDVQVKLKMILSPKDPIGIKLVQRPTM